MNICGFSWGQLGVLGNDNPMRDFVKGAKKVSGNREIPMTVTESEVGQP